MAKILTEERNWAMACHLTAFFSLLVFPAGLIVSLVLWLIKKDTSRFIRNHGAESINFQISVYLYLIGFIMILASSFLIRSVEVGTMLLFIGALGVPVVMGLLLYGVIRGTIKAYRGEEYLAPLCIRFIKPLI